MSINCISFPGDRWLLATAGLLLATCVAPPAAAQGTPLRIAGSPSDPAADLLLRRIQSLRSQVLRIESAIGALQSKAPAIESEIDRLLRDLESLQGPEPEKEDEKPKPAEKPREVSFRPPLLRKVDKETPLAIVCNNRHVFVLDLDEENAAFKRIKEDSTRLQAFIKAGGGKLPAGDFEMELKLISIGGGTFYIQQTVHPKPGHAGEPFETALQDSSKLQTRLRKIDAAQSVIQFAVYPDSFDVFRGLRARLWDQKVGVNWFPMSHGETMKVGGGGGGIGVQ